MNLVWRDRIYLTLLLAAAALIFFTGIEWGLPSSSVNAALFGDHPVWTGKQILSLLPQRSVSQPADVDADPSPRGSMLNATDAQRAQIVRRYRLFSAQPDEAITLMSLAAMHPSAGDFDPRLYQYGGLWIYPIGALIKLILHPVADQAYYLDHPDAFAKFYIVARAYSAAWGVLGAAVVYVLMRRSGGTPALSLVTGWMYCALPIVINAAHEAKPHLAGAVLTLLAIERAHAFVRNGRRRDAWLAAVFCGGASGVVLSGLSAWPIIPLLILLRNDSTRSRIALFSQCLALALGIYAVTNPYVILHLFVGRSMLIANIQNTQAMYVPQGWLAGAKRGMELLVEATSEWQAIVGIAAAVVIGCFWRTRHTAGVRMLVVCSLLLAIQFAHLAGGKLAEYARFGLLIDITLVLSMGMLIAVGIRRENWRWLVLLWAFTFSTQRGVIYFLSFVTDSYRHGYQRRPLAQSKLADLAATQQTIGLWDEPAPYSLPPADLFRWKLMLLPKEFDLHADQTPADVLVRPSDSPASFGTSAGQYTQSAPTFPIDEHGPLISWANKPIEVWCRKSSTTQP